MKYIKGVVNITNTKGDRTPQEKEALFLQFVDSYVTFLIYVCNHSLLNCKAGQRFCQELEFNMIRFLTLMWQLHVTNTILKSGYLEMDFTHGTSITYNHEQSKRIMPKFKKLKKIIQYIPCFQSENKRYCLSLLNQTQSYYQPNDYAFIEDNFNVEPWLTGMLNTVKTKEERCIDKVD